LFAAHPASIVESGGSTAKGAGFAGGMARPGLFKVLDEQTDRKATMRMKTLGIGCLAVVLVMAALAGVPGCVEQGAGLFRNEPAPIIEEYPIFYQKAGKYCGAKREMRLVVRDQAHMAFVPVGDVPVDFNSQMVLFVTTGQVYSESYDIQIDRVWRQGRLVRVGITKTYPQAGEMGFPHPCSPYHLVVVPKSDLNVEGFVAEVTPPKMQGEIPTGPLPPPRTPSRAR
jgi:hypothetical protein